VSRSPRPRWLLAPLGAALVLAVSLPAPTPAADDPTPKDIQALTAKAYDFLKTKQNKDGSFAKEIGGPGVSALVVAALVRNGYGPDDPVVSKTLEYLESQVQKDGGIYDKKLANYTTSVAVMALKEVNTKGKYDTILKNTSTFLKKLQWDDSLVEDKNDVKVGGVGYDAKSRPDMSNSHYFVEALLAAGVPRDDPAIQRALKFVSRCQNLPGETNDQAYAKKTTEKDKGGLVYNPVPGEKNPGTIEGGGLRSEGAMTYAGLKTFLYAGVDKNDPRVKACVDWIRRNYTLDENPGRGKAGLYYYYHTFAKAMDAFGEEDFADKDGKKHKWRAELYDALKKSQQNGGFWVNDKRDAYGEGSPELATSFALLALSYTKPKK